MRTLPRSIAAVLFAFSLGLPAMADTTITTDFTYDLNQSASWNYEQIQKTAEDACAPRADSTSVISFYARANEAECAEDLVDQAVGLIGIDALTTLHLGNVSNPILAAAPIS